MRNEDDAAASRVEFRWGHSDGISSVGVVTLGNTEKLITCGEGEELRVWKGFDDEDPVAHDLTDNGLTLVCGKEEIYVGTEAHSVESLSLEDGKNLGVKAKFAGAVNHVDLSQDGKWLVAGSGDMTIQIVHLADSSIPPVKIETHSAPVLSVALDPQKNFLASSGCDGNVCIWSLTEEGKPVHLVKKLESVFPSSNDITTSSTLCRISWGPNGKILAVPEDGHIALYTRDSWAKLKVLKSQLSKKIASVTKFSQCGSYLVVGGSDGTLTVWNISDSSILVEYAQFADHITDLAFANNESDIVATDIKGRVLRMKNFKVPLTSSSETSLNAASKAPPICNESEVMDDDDLASPPSSPKSLSAENNDADAFDDGMDDIFGMEDNEISISKLKAEAGFVDDEYVGVSKAQKIITGGDMTAKINSDDDDDGASSISSFSSIKPSKNKKSSRPVPPQPKIIIPTTEPQNPFQPASSPSHLDHRFMVWNNTGIIRNYSHDDDEKQAIDIEFHDAAVHHAVHLRNQHDYTLAILSKEVAVFANGKQHDAGSKLFCYSFTSWDTKKEWSTDLPSGEEVIGLAAGDGWIAASTDMNRVRLFTLGGAQKQIIEIGGQIIATAGYEDLLFITFHNGIGLHGNQCIAYAIFRIKSSMKPFPLVSCEPLPISPMSKITWIGFSDEGTPVCSDSEDILRILGGRYWTTFCSMKEHLVAGSPDHFWVVGVSELDQRIRAVKCKGMRYPPTLPRPVLMQLDAQMPFCEMGTEKSRLEDRLHRSLMLDALSKKMDKKNYEVDEYKSRAEKELKESLFNLFVLSCKGEWDCRGTEYVSMMPSAHAVQVAVKYASKLRRKGLVDRLTAVGRKKLDEEDLDMEGDDDDFETLKMGTIVYSNVQNRTLAADYSASPDLFAETSSSRLNTSTSSLSNSFSNAGSRSVISIPEEENPFMKKNTDDIRKLLGSVDTPANRFRKGQPQATSSGENGEAGKGLSVIDSWKKPTEKPADLFSKAITKNTKAGRKSGADKNKDQASTNKDKKKQATLLNLGRKPNNNITNPASPLVADGSEESNDSTILENQRLESESHQESTKNSESLLEDSTNLQHQEKPAAQKPATKSGFMLWFDENKETLEKDNPEMGSKELTRVGMQLFKQLPAEEKKKYAANNQGDEKKRKRSEIEDEESERSIGASSEGEKKSKISSKLAAFVRTNKD